MTLHGRELIVQTVWSVLLLIVGYIASLKGDSLFGFAKVASVYVLFFVGVLLSSNKEKYNKMSDKFYILSGIGTVIILLVLNKYGNVNIARNSYVNPVFLIVASVSGWILLFSIAHFVVRSRLCQCFEYIGKRTLSILILHFLSFKIVALIISLLYGLPLYYIAAFPNLYGNHGFWWIAYILVGVFIPLFLRSLYDFIMIGLKSRF